jgi:hypothetical protein
MIQSDIKEQYRQYCVDHLDIIRHIKLPKISNHKWTLKEAVNIEFRILPHLEFIIRNTINKLGPTWSHTIVCGNLNINHIKAITDKINKEMIENYGQFAGQMRIIKVDMDNITVSQYSILLANLDFWNALIGEKILIYQDDTCIFEDNIDDFLYYDYIGAQFPTNIFSGTYVGNGGLSLRSKSIMKQIITSKHILTVELDQDYDEIKEKYNNATNKIVVPEDIYFCKIMNDYGIGELANLLEANKFSVEYCYDSSIYPFGGHCFWNSIPNWKQYMKERVIDKMCCLLK